MTVDDVTRVVEAELRGVRDPDTEMRIRALLVWPYPAERDWEHGKRLTCWTVAEDVDAGTAIAYSDQGFGPARPWGVVSLAGHEVGRDWFRSLEDAVKSAIG